MLFTGGIYLTKGKCFVFEALLILGGLLSRCDFLTVIVVRKSSFLLNRRGYFFKRIDFLPHINLHHGLAIFLNLFPQGAFPTLFGNLLCAPTIIPLILMLTF
jgi:hypothetical protein